MKMNNKILSIPPYISTSWNNIVALCVKEEVLVIHLNEGGTVQIPNLPKETLEKIFNMHSSFLEEKEVQKPSSLSSTFFQQFQDDLKEMETPLKFGIGALEGWGSALIHNPSQSSAPDLPKEVLDKIGSLAKIIDPAESNALPKPEPHCNCLYCQIARNINKALGNTDIYRKHEEKEEKEEEVSDEDLKFQQWKIEQKDDKLYAVTNRLDAQEKYNVYLGNPVGCTCGNKGCEHILAVLKS